jgi:hypothetical protein
MSAKTLSRLYETVESLVSGPWRTATPSERIGVSTDRAVGRRQPAAFVSLRTASSCPGVGQIWFSPRIGSSGVELRGGPA